MQKIFIALSLLLSAAIANAQALQNNGATLTITSGANLFVAGNVVNGTGTISNNGTLNVKANITNNATITSSAGSSLLLNGTSAQTLSGTTMINTTNLTVNNAAGITLATPLRVSGAITFSNGILKSPDNAAALTVTASGSLANTPTDASHVNGYVIKEGTGSFDYPVGDATKYQKLTLNLTGNVTGMSVRYFATNAGTGTFTAAGTEATPLVSYNNNEYWEAAPLSTATGTVTVYWDGYNDAYSNPVAQRKVAHRVTGNWQNEGNIATGTVGSGSVTSNPLSIWSPFTLGSITSILPLNWLSIHGALDGRGHAILDWSVAESDVADYRVEKSSDGSNFLPVAMISSNGTGTHSYHFSETDKLPGTAFFRVLQTDKNGHSSYSSVVKIAVARKGILVYPTVFRSGFNIISENPVNGQLIDLQGRIIKTISLNTGVNKIRGDELAPGTYLISFANGYQQRIIKE